MTATPISTEDYLRNEIMKGNIEAKQNYTIHNDEKTKQNANGQETYRAKGDIDRCKKEC